MLIWGSSRKIVEAGDGGTHFCAVCKESRRFTNFLSYKLSHVWFLIRWPSQRQYHRRCEACHNLFDIDLPANFDALAGDQAKPKSPIPFFDRWGWAVALAVFALLVVVAMISQTRTNAEESKFIAQPESGDLYVVAVDRFEEGFESQSVGSDYGVFRVTKIQGDKVELAAPKKVYSGRSGADKTIANGSAKGGDYYEGATVKSIAELQALHASGAIVSVERGGN